MTGKTFLAVLSLGSAVMFWKFFQAYGVNEPRFWHLILSTAAYVPVMAVGITVFSNDSVANFRNRQLNQTVHGGLLALSFVLVTAGIGFEFVSKVQDGRKHFAITHGILGLASWAVSFAAVGIGLLSATQRIPSSVARKLHRILGLLAFLLGIGALVFKFDFFLQNSAILGYGLLSLLVYVTVKCCKRPLLRLLSLSQLI